MRHFFSLLLIFLLGIPTFVLSIDSPLDLDSLTHHPFYRTPAPSPDGSQLAFSYQGDLWLTSIHGGKAIRLTTHGEYNYFPVWSPDGNEIAFGSLRYGNLDVFVLTLDTGKVDRLTYHTNWDVPQGWTPDGDAVYFTSVRAHAYPLRNKLYAIHRTGGNPWVVIGTELNQASVSPNQKQVAFSKGPLDLFRKGYRGSHQSDLWIYDIPTDQYLSFTNHNGEDHSPIFSSDGTQIFYVSDKSGTANLWVYSIDTTTHTQLTEFSDDGPRHLAYAANGSVFAFEWLFDIGIYFPETGETEILTIQPFGEESSEQYLSMSATSGMDTYAVSPDENQIAFTVRGELFIMGKEGGNARHIPTGYGKEEQLTWHPNGTKLVYVSDKLGNQDIYMMEPDESDPPYLWLAYNIKHTQLTSSSENEYAPCFSPDGTRLAYLRNRGDLILHDLETHTETVLLESPSTWHYQWAPDGNWIVLTMQDNYYNPDVYILNLETKRLENISRHPDMDHSMNWSPDGKRLVFTSARFGEDLDLWYVNLQIEEDQKTEEDRQIEALLQAATEPEPSPQEPDPNQSTDSPDESEEDASVTESDQTDDQQIEDTDENTESNQIEPISIDFDRISYRLKRVAQLVGNQDDPLFTPDGSKILFRYDKEGESDLWKIDIDGENLTRLTSGNMKPSQLTLNKEGTLVYFMANGGLWKMDVGGGAPTSIAFNAQFQVDLRGERLQKFNECWQRLATSFYDPNFHGCDWQAMYHKYVQTAVSCTQNNDYNTVIRLMLGELNASHLGIWGGISYGHTTDRTAELGIYFQREQDPAMQPPATPGLFITHVVPDGPCDQEANRVYPGERLIAIDSIPITTSTNLYSLLNHKAGRRTQLRLYQTETDSERVVFVRPASWWEYVGQEYEAMIRERQCYVDEWSGERLGYMHIRNMHMNEFYRFEREVYATGYGKDALVIDVRDNGGGWITDYLLTILNVQPHAKTKSRGGELGYPQDRLPFFFWSKPIIVLCNEYSFSNAEIFSHAIKTLERGPLVGMPTAGGVISTYNIGLIDGTRFNIPMRGWYVEGSMVNQELNGCVPDYIVPVLPDEEVRGEDPQLHQAVKVMMELLE